MLPISSSMSIDDLILQKFIAIDKMDKVLSFINEQNQKKLVKTASIDQNNLVTLFVQMLSCLNLKVSDGNAKNVLDTLSSNSPDLTKESAAKNANKERKDEIKIASKNIKDSHYQIDLSKDVIVRNNKKLYMISCYARDAYLGRYLIKRNYFYTYNRESFADNSYDEILTKMNSLKERYYDETSDVSEIFPQIKTILDGVISQIKSEEDSLGTNVNRQP